MRAVSECDTGLAIGLSETGVEADLAICDVGNCRIGEYEAVTVLEDLLHTGGQAAGRAGEGEAGARLVLGRFEVKRYHEPGRVKISSVEWELSRKYFFNS